MSKVHAIIAAGMMAFSPAQAKADDTLTAIVQAGVAFNQFNESFPLRDATEQSFPVKDIAHCADIAAAVSEGLDQSSHTSCKNNQGKTVASVLCKRENVGNVLRPKFKIVCEKVLPLNVSP